MHSEPVSVENRKNPGSGQFAGPFDFAQKRLAVGALLLRTTYRLAPDASLGMFLRFLSKPRLREEIPDDPRFRIGWKRGSLPFETGTLMVFEPLETQGCARILLVHGWGGSSAQMRTVAKVLVEAGFCPTLVDLPAHGKSSGHRSGMAQFSRVLFALQARFGRFHGVVGHSAGALASAHAITRALAVDRLVLISPPESPSRMVQSAAVAFGLPDSWSHRMVERLSHQGGVCFSEFELERMARQISLPTLIVHDEGDRVAPVSSSRRIAALFSSGELLVTDGLGHQRLLHDGEVSSRVLHHMTKNRTPSPRSQHRHA